MEKWKSGKVEKSTHDLEKWKSGKVEKSGRDLEKWKSGKVEKSNQEVEKWKMHTPLFHFSTFLLFHFMYDFSTFLL